MPDATIPHTPKGWPYLDENNYWTTIDDYTLELAKKLENSDSSAAAAINAATAAKASADAAATAAGSASAVRGVFIHNARPNTGVAKGTPYHEDLDKGTITNTLGLKTGGRMLSGFAPGLYVVAAHVDFTRPLQPRFMCCKNPADPGGVNGPISGIQLSEISTTSRADILDVAAGDSFSWPLWCDDPGTVAGYRLMIVGLGVGK